MSDMDPHHLPSFLFPFNWKETTAYIAAKAVSVLYPLSFSLQARPRRRTAMTRDKQQTLHERGRGLLLPFSSSPPPLPGFSEESLVSAPWKETRRPVPRPLPRPPPFFLFATDAACMERTRAASWSCSWKPSFSSPLLRAARRISHTSLSFFPILPA